MVELILVKTHKFLKHLLHFLFLKKTQKASIDVLRKKHVLLFISDLDISHEELLILDQMYHESREHPTRPESQYEVAWLPVVDRSIPWDEAKQKQFETHQSAMLWYSLSHPSLLHPTMIR